VISQNVLEEDADVRNWRDADAEERDADDEERYGRSVGNGERRGTERKDDKERRNRNESARISKNVGKCANAKEGEKAENGGKAEKESIENDGKKGRYAVAERR